jgi:hypothetical protein
MQQMAVEPVEAKRPKSRSRQRGGKGVCYRRVWRAGSARAAPTGAEGEHTANAIWLAKEWHLGWVLLLMLPALERLALDHPTNIRRRLLAILIVVLQALPRSERKGRRSAGAAI